MKFASGLFVILVLLTSGILFFQYQVYSSNEANVNNKFNYSQEIEITYKNNSLDIRQHFRNLPMQEISIKWPKSALNTTCFLETKTSCKRLTDTVMTFKQGNITSQSVSYVIPLNGGLKPKQLIRDILAELNNGTVEYTTLHISTDTNVKGQWVTGLPLMGEQSLSLLNYTLFSGEGTVDDLYWQTGKFSVQLEEPAVTIYSSTPLTAELQKQIKELSFLNNQHIAIIHGNLLNTTGVNRLLFLPNLSIATIGKEVILSQVNANYEFVNSPSWLPALISSYVVNMDFGSTKVQQIRNELEKYFTSEDMKQWVTMLKELEGKKVSPEILDDKLAILLEGKTSFFQMNTKYKDGIYPILFEDPRPIYFNELPLETVKVILLEGQIMYTVDPLLKAIGYQTDQGPMGYYANNATRVFRFPLDEGFYVFNQQRYNTLSEPIVKIGNEYYVEEAWLQRLFLVELQKNEKQIDITIGTP